MPRPKKQSNEHQELNIPPYVLEEAQKVYERLQNVHTKILAEPPKTPDQNIVIEFDPALLQHSLRQALEQLLEGKEPILDLNLKLQLTPNKLVACIEKCFQEASGPIRISGSTYHLGSWQRTKQSKSNQSSSVPPEDLQEDIEKKLKSTLNKKQQDKK